MKFDVRFTRRAGNDFDRLLNYIAERSPQGALAWVNSLDQAIELLKQNPFGTSLAPEDADQDVEIRQFFFRTRSGLTYRGVVTIDAEVVYILHLRGPGQNLVSPNDLSLP